MPLSKRNALELTKRLSNASSILKCLQSDLYEEVIILQASLSELVKKAKYLHNLILENTKQDKEPSH